jgi:hypothetical protein
MLTSLLNIVHAIAQTLAQQSLKYFSALLKILSCIAFEASYKPNLNTTHSITAKHFTTANHARPINY